VKKKIITVLIILSLLLLGYISFNTIVASLRQNLSYIILDVNPSVMLTIDKNENLRNVESRNEEADILLSNINLVGMKIEPALEVFMREVIAMGYIDEYSDVNVITITAITDLENVRQRLEGSIIEKLNGVASEKGVNLFTLAMGLSRELKEEAARNNISVGKMLMINRATNLNIDLRREALFNFSKNAIRNEIRKSTEVKRSLNRNQLIQQKNNIIEENAKQKTLFEEEVFRLYVEENPNIIEEFDEIVAFNMAITNKKEQISENYNKIVANFKGETAGIKNSVEEYGEDINNYIILEDVSDDNVNKIMRDIISSELNNPLRVIVLFKNRVDKGIIEQAQGRLNREYINVPALAITVPSTALQGLRNNPNVELIESDFQVNATAQVKDWGIDRIGAPNSWQSGLTGRGVRVAIIDTGIARHEDLTIAGGVAFTTYTTSFHDDNGHGTHVAGIIGARNNIIGTVGIAPEADLFAVKVLGQDGTGYLSDLVAGIDWSINNRMHIINMSLGTSSSSSTLQRIVDAAYNQNILIVASAGNAGNSEGIGDNVLYPARYNSVIAVGATDVNDNRASFSSTGSDLEFSAPGVRIISSYLNDSYIRISGTSMASPYVAGNFSLLKQLYPNLSVSNLRSRMQNNVIDLGTTGRNSLFGYGLIQAFINEEIVEESAQEIEPTPNRLPAPSPPKPRLPERAPTPPATLLTTTTTVSTDKGTYIPRERVLVRATVMDIKGDLVKGANVVLNVITPTGSRFTSTNITDANGEVLFTYITRGNDPRGTYSVSIRSLYKGHTPSEAIINFEVAAR
jgi:minor extracellular protease Epr